MSILMLKPATDIQGHCEHIHKDAPENAVCKDCYKTTGVMKFIDVILTILIWLAVAFLVFAIAVIA